MGLKAAVVAKSPLYYLDPSDPDPDSLFLYKVQVKSHFDVGSPFYDVFLIQSFLLVAYSYFSYWLSKLKFRLLTSGPILRPVSPRLLVLPLRDTMALPSSVPPPTLKFDLFFTSALRCLCSCCNASLPDKPPADSSPLP